MASINQSRSVRFYAVVFTVLFVVQGCSTVPRAQVPKELTEQAGVEGIPGAREWGDVPSEGYFQLLDMNDEQLQAEFKGIYGREHHYLALSGGSSRGAFGAGLLAGWAEHGDRPTFTMVSGVSTGALIAPYAFLGPEYDHIIKEVYTEHSTKDLFRRKNIFAIMGGDSVSDVSGFVAMIKHYLPDSLIDEIAAQHRLGRMLIVGTTNLDAARPVMWNLGTIAASDHPDKYDLVRQVIMASASLPVAFPPEVISVAANGETYDEMHVDGGVANQVFVYPLGMDWALLTEKLKVEGRPTLYVIRNAQINPQWAVVDRKATKIGIRSLNSLMRTQGLGDLYRIYVGAQRDNIDFNLAYIPDDFVDNSKEAVDKDTMVELYRIGQELGRGGYHWYKLPPGAKAEDEEDHGVEPGEPEAAATDSEEEPLKTASGGL